MEIIIDLLPTVIGAALSLAGVVVSALIAKKTAKITAEAEIQKLKMELEHTDKVRDEDLARAREQELCDARQGMLVAISDYGERPDRNTKSTALAAVTRLWTAAEGDTKYLAEQVMDIIQASDPFDGPDFAELRPLMARINSGR